jgi:hypothetical protein
MEARRFGGLEVEHEFRTLSAPAPAAPTPYSLRSSWLAVILLYIMGISRSAASVVTDSMSRCKSSGNSDNSRGRGIFSITALPSLSRTATRNSDASFDHLVGDGEHFVGNLEPKCLGGLEIDDEIGPWGMPSVRSFSCVDTKLHKSSIIQ